MHSVCLILSLCSCTVPPLFVIEFLHRIVDVFMEYFGDCTELKIKENYVTVYEVYIVTDTLEQTLKW